MGRFLGVALRPGESATLSECAVTHASLVDPTAGACSLYAGSTLLLRLDESNPQQPFSLLLGEQSLALTCEGAAGSPGLHLLGRGAHEIPPPRKRRREDAPPADEESPNSEESPAAPFISPAPSAASASRKPRLSKYPACSIAECP